MKKKKQREYSKKEMDEYKIRRVKEVSEKYLLGRKFIQTKEYFGLKEGRVGWVIRTGPTTAVLFEDGRCSTVPPEFCECLEGTDDYTDNVAELEERIMAARSKPRTRKIG